MYLDQRRDLFVFVSLSLSLIAIYTNLKYIRTAARCSNVLAAYLAFRIPLTFNGRFTRLTFATDAVDASRAPSGGRGRGTGGEEGTKGRGDPGNSRGGGEAYLVEVRLKKPLILVDRTQAEPRGERFHSGW